MQKALSVVDIYLTEYKDYQADINEGMKVIYAQMNVFWAAQEELLRNHEIDNDHRSAIHRDAQLSAIITVSRKLSEHADRVQRRLVQIAGAVRQSQGGLLSNTETR